MRFKKGDTFLLDGETYYVVGITPHGNWYNVSGGGKSRVSSSRADKDGIAFGIPTPLQKPMSPNPVKLYCARDGILYEYENISKGKFLYIVTNPDGGTHPMGENEFKNLYTILWLQIGDMLRGKHFDVVFTVKSIHEAEAGICAVLEFLNKSANLCERTECIDALKEFDLL